VRRRRFIALAGGALLAPLAHSQPRGKVRRVGYLATAPITAFTGPFGAFVEGMRALGYVEGNNLALVVRSAEGKPERLDALAVELARSDVEVIVTAVNGQTHAARRATSTIPIVMTVGTDVIKEGFVASLARPGGNITGLTWDVGLEIMAKRFEFLKEALPGLERVAVLWDPGQDAASAAEAIAKGGEQAGLKLIWLNLKDPAELEQLIGIAQRERAQALFTGGGARIFQRRKEVVVLAAKYRLPDTHYSAEFVDAGGLMSYAPNLPAMFRRAATYVDKILRGARPADLPVEQPTKIDLVINLRTAKAFGLSLPQLLLVRADRVIE
jgi:putative ABC transport system substrate-binding protein